MIHVAPTLIALAVLTLPAATQTVPQPLGYTGATHVATVTGSVELTDTTILSAKKGTTGYSVCVWAISTGGIEYSLAVDAVTFTGDSEVIDTVTAPYVFDLIARDAIRRGIDSGYAQCGEARSTGLTLASCVRRSGERYVASGSGTVRRAYSYSCFGSMITSATYQGYSGQQSCGTEWEGTGTGPELQ